MIAGTRAFAGAVRTEVCVSHVRVIFERTKREVIDYHGAIVTAATEADKDHHGRNFWRQILLH